MSYYNIRHSFARALALQSHSRNCNPAPELVLWKLTFQCVLFIDTYAYIYIYIYTYIYIYIYIFIYTCIVQRGVVFTDAGDSRRQTRLQLAKYWRSTGEVLARYWRGTGEVLARYWRGTGEVLASWLPLGGADTGER